jgi:hypothetical protein
MEMETVIKIKGISIQKRLDCLRTGELILDLRAKDCKEYTIETYLPGKPPASLGRNPIRPIYVPPNTSTPLRPESTTGILRSEDYVHVKGNLFRKLEEEAYTKKRKTQKRTLPWSLILQGLSLKEYLEARHTIRAGKHGPLTKAELVETLYPMARRWVPRVTKRQISLKLGSTMRWLRYKKGIRFREE